MKETAIVPKVKLDRSSAASVRLQWKSIPDPLPYLDGSDFNMSH